MLFSMCNVFHVSTCQLIWFLICVLTVCWFLPKIVICTWQLIYGVHIGTLISHVSVQVLLQVKYVCCTDHLTRCYHIFFLLIDLVFFSLISSLLSVLFFQLFGSDGETFISADDLRINLWNLEISNQSFNIVDVKPANMEDLTG